MEKDALEKLKEEILFKLAPKAYDAIVWPASVEQAIKRTCGDSLADFIVSELNGAFNVMTTSDCISLKLSDVLDGKTTKDYDENEILQECVSFMQTAIRQLLMVQSALINRMK